MMKITNVALFRIEITITSKQQTWFLKRNLKIMILTNRLYFWAIYNNISLNNHISDRINLIKEYLVRLLGDNTLIF